MESKSGTVVVMAVRNFLTWLGAAAVLCATPAQAVTDADRDAVYREFLSQYQAKKYTEAQPR